MSRRDRVGEGGREGASKREGGGEGGIKVVKKEERGEGGWEMDRELGRRREDGKQE